MKKAVIYDRNGNEKIVSIKKAKESIELSSSFLGLDPKETFDIFKQADYNVFNPIWQNHIKTINKIIWQDHIK